MLLPLTLLPLILPPLKLLLLALLLPPLLVMPLRLVATPTSTCDRAACPPTPFDKDDDDDDESELAPSSTIAAAFPGYSSDFNGCGDDTAFEGSRVLCCPAPAAAPRLKLPTTTALYARVEVVGDTGRALTSSLFSTPGDDSTVGDDMVTVVAVEVAVPGPFGAQVEVAEAAIVGDDAARGSFATLNEGEREGAIFIFSLPDGDAAGDED